MHNCYNNIKEKQVMLITNYCLLQLKHLNIIVLEFALSKNKIPTQKIFYTLCTF